MNMRRILGLSLLCCMAGSAQSQPQFSMQFLPTLGGAYNEPLGIGNSGHIVGYSTTAANWGHGYLYFGGTMTEFPPFGGTSSSGVDVNSLGHVVGESSVSGTGLPHSFIYRNGTMSDLGEIEAGMWTHATGINDSDQVSGYMETWTDRRAFVWEEGVFTELGSLSGGWTTANGINNAGQIVGSSGGVPYVYQGGVMSALPTFLDGGDAVAINESGTIVGYAPLNVSEDHAVVWQGGSIMDIGTLGGQHSAAMDINGPGAIVGISELADNNQRPFLYVSGTMYDLNLLHDQPEWTLFKANAINDAGQIVGVAYHAGTQELRGVVLNPVPEPASMVALGLGLAAALARRKRQA